MIETYILPASVGLVVSSAITISSLLGYKIKEGWRRNKEMYQLDNLTRRISMARDSAKYFKELGYNEAGRKRAEIADAYESLLAQKRTEWRTLSLGRKLEQAIVLGFS